MLLGFLQSGHKWHLNCLDHRARKRGDGPSLVMLEDIEDLRELKITEQPSKQPGDEPVKEESENTKSI